MIILPTTTDKLQLITSAGGSVNVHAAYLDNVSGSVAPGRQNTRITTATTTDILSPPASGAYRNLKTLHVYNAGAANNVVTVQHTDGTTPVQLHAVTLAPGATLQYVDEVGFLIQASTAPVASPTTGDLKLTHKTTADLGWIMWVDGTIGDGSSGASVFADPSTSALFALYYGFTDAQCPLFTSTGAATTRAAQGTASAAYAAHCRLSMPLGSGRALGLAGAGAGLTSRTLGSSTGTESNTPSVATMANHNHAFQSAPYYPLVEWPGYPANFSFGGDHDITTTNINPVGGGGVVNNMPPIAFINVMVKL